MGGSTAAPWSIPYPTGTDRVADGDNAIQAVCDRLHAIIATTTVAPWVNLTLASGTAIIAGFGTPAARLIPGGMVEVRGLVQSASATQGVIIATLPAGHFPPANVRKAVQLATSGGGSQVGIVNIGFTGNITVEYAASAGNVLAVSLDFTFSYI